MKITSANEQGKKVGIGVGVSLGVIIIVLIIILVIYYYYINNPELVIQGEYTWDNFIQTISQGCNKCDRDQITIDGVVITNYYTSNGDVGQ